MPEETMVLACPSPRDKTDWLTSLQSAIKQALQSTNKTASGNNGRATPPLVQSASYTFTKLAILKDVT